MPQMSDLVKRLRAWQTPGETITGDVALYLEAAARIEALEAALRTAKDYVFDIHALRVINAALAPEQDK
jgi:hypothetical protein